MSDVTFYSMSQVAENDGKNGNRVWVVIKDTVYDVTDYLEEHPGGGDLIREEAGKDATRQFNDFGHSSDARNTLKGFKIGELAESDRKQKLKGPKVEKCEDIKNSRSCLGILTCGCLM